MILAASFESLKLSMCTLSHSGRKSQECLPSIPSTNTSTSSLASIEQCVSEEAETPSTQTSESDSPLPVKVPDQPEILVGEDLKEALKETLDLDEDDESLNIGTPDCSDHYLFFNPTTVIIPERCITILEALQVPQLIKIVSSPFKFHQQILTPPRDHCRCFTGRT